MSDTTRDGLREKIAELLSDDWACTRVWEAWNYNTMTQDDFEPLNETPRVEEIERLINDHVLAVLERLERQKHTLSVLNQTLEVVYVSQIEKEKQNYAKQ